MNAFLMPEDSQLRTVFIPYELLQNAQADGTGPKMAQNFGVGQKLTLSVAEAQKLQLGQSFASVRQITEACTAIYTTRFDAVEPKPDWYDGLHGQFEVVKGYSKEWLENYSIAVASTIPKSIINFVPTFNSSAHVIKTITDRSIGDLSPSDLSVARDVLARLITKVDEISKNVTYYVKVDGASSSGKLVTWKNNMREAGKELKKGSASIQTAATSMSNEIQEYNGKIKVLEADICAYNKLISLGAGLVGSGAFVSAIGLGLCFAFPVVGGIVLALGIGMVAGGASVWGVYQSKINQANRDIINYQQRIATNKQTIVALGSLSSGVESALNSSDSAITNLETFAISWDVFSGSLQKTIAALDEGRQEAKGILLAMDMETACENWSDTKKYAQDLINVPTEIKQVPAEHVA